MRPAVLVMMIAASAAVLTAVLAKSWMDRQMPQPVENSAQATTEILVVARDVAAGTKLQTDDLRYEEWPEHNRTPRMIVRQPDSDPKSQYLGQIARRPLTEGEPLSGAALIRTEQMGVLAGMLTPGMRAVSIAITNPSAVSGFITPGDKVDIVLAADLQRMVEQGTGGRTPAIQRFAAETVLTDIRILAIDQQIARAKDGNTIQGKTATVEVTPKQAEILTAVGMLGQLQLVLRGLPMDKPETETASLSETGFTGDVDSSKALKTLLGSKPVHGHAASGSAITINRAGQISEGTVR